MGLTPDELEYIEYLDWRDGEGAGIMLIRDHPEAFGIGIDNYFQIKYNRFPER